MAILFTLRRRRTSTLQIDVARNGAALPLEGCRVTLTVKEWVDQPDAEAPILLSSGAGITHTATPGRAVAYLSDDLNRSLEAGRDYYGEVRVDDLAGDFSYTPDGLYGRVTVNPSTSPT